jgi:hypothetical protein
MHSVSRVSFSRDSVGNFGFTEFTRDWDRWTTSMVEVTDSSDRLQRWPNSKTGTNQARLTYWVLSSD